MLNPVWWLKKLQLYPKVLYLFPFLMLINESLTNLAIKKSIAFEDFIKGKQLIEKPLKQRKIGKNFCALLCLHHAQCLSFRYCTNLYCFLHSIDIYSIDSVLTNSQHGCIYQGMRRDVEPDCTSGVDPEICAVDGKKQDGEWSQWVHSVQVDTPLEWKKSRVRDCHPPSHGGAHTCTTREEEVLEWVEFVHQKVNWITAKRYCQALGGHLFHSLNGTLEQLSFFWEKVNQKAFWVGVRKKGEWVDMNDEVIPNERLLWSDDQPDNRGGIEQYVGANSLGLHDFSFYQQLSVFVCEIVWLDLR